MRSLPWLVKMTGDARLLLVHNNFTTLDDLDRLGPDTTRLWWALCPASNAYISGTSPNEFLIRRFPERICIGTDSLASNDRLSVLEELKILQSALPDLDLRVLLRAACHNGAEALGMDGSLGSFEKGKRPGVNLIQKADLVKMKLCSQAMVKVIAGC